MLRLSDVEFRYEPYPIGCIRPAFAKVVYGQLLDSYPDLSLFQHKPQIGDKYSLSEINNPDQYHKFIAETKVWKEFYDFVKSDDFIFKLLGFMRKRNVDLGLGDVLPVSRKKTRSSSVWSRIRRKTELRTRFEFSVIGAQGGHLRPHTDSQNKLITLVLAMVRPGEWNTDWGGGTAICLPKDRTRIYNQVNRYMEFDQVDTVHTYEFQPNQCVVFVKTYDSWHHVAPIKAPETAPMRRTLTINIERLP